MWVRQRSCSVQAILSVFVDETGLVEHFPQHRANSLSLLGAHAVAHVSNSLAEQGA